MRDSEEVGFVGLGRRSDSTLSMVVEYDYGGIIGRRSIYPFEPHRLTRTVGHIHEEAEVDAAHRT
jgi:hypothetical protein